MRFAFLFGSAVVYLLFTGCNSTTPPPPPSGVVYEGKHVSEWGDQLKNSDQAARIHAVKVLIKMGKEGYSTKEAIRALEGALTDENADVRGWSVIALVHAVRGTPYPIGQKAEPVAALKEAAESSNEELRAEATAIRQRFTRPPRGKKEPTTTEDGKPQKKPAEEEKKNTPEN